MPSIWRALPILVLLAVAVPLAAQRASDAAALVARAERMQDVDDEGARRILEQVLPALTRPEDRALRMKALALHCWASTATLESDALVSLAERGMAEARRAGDARAYADLRTCRGYGYGYASGGRRDQAVADYDFGVAEGRRLHDEPLLATALMVRGELRYYRGELGAALEDLDESYGIYSRIRADSRIRYTLNAIANIYADPRVAQYDRALEYYRQLVVANRRAGAETNVATSYYNIASTLEQKGDLEAALANYRRALELERRLGHADEVSQCRRSIGVVLSKLGRPGEALRWLEQALAYFDEQGDAESAARTRLSRGAALRRLGRPADALRDLDAAAARFDSTGNARFLERVQDERAQVLTAVGDLRGALDARNAQLALQASLAGQLREENTSRLRVRFDAQRKEQENRALLRENRDAARIRRLQTAVIGLGLVIIAILAYLVARHIRNERRMRALAMTDELTRLPNRRHLLHVAGERVAAARRGTGPLSVLALDIDHFKRINDTFGHEIGDRVLHRVAEACRSALRRDDVIGRTGGEEFIVVMPGADTRVALEVAERLRAAVERAEWADVADGLRVTVSVGASEWSPRDESFAALARRADDSLYRAKELGRNRTEFVEVG